ncbi:MAG: cytochrome ubiquinol oxidase subunit I [Thermoguttaceae bacterium]|jgi:cytochrome d ubiquinol oxidase subunit I
MSYPWWYVPALTSPMVIAIVAVVHVLVSQYAVGGGILLALENSYALKTGDSEYRKYWKSHAKFFILLTVVFGSITGVGIWWAIGLASPLATEELIRIFIFGWAIEWVFFILELVAAFGFYYFWDRLPKSTHETIGWIYASAAWISLVLITGITSFMLNSRGIFGDWERTGGFWFAFFNRQFIPQTLLRTGISLVLATIYVYMHITWGSARDTLREKTIRRMRIPSIVGVVLMVLGVGGWLLFLPQSARMMLESIAVLNIFLGIFVGASAAILLLLLLGPFRAPQKMNFTSSLSLFLLAIAAIGSSEFIREGIRKPFLIDQVVYGNQIMVSQSGPISRSGYLNSGVWTGLYLKDLQEKYPTLRIYTPANILAGSRNLSAGGGTFTPTAGSRLMTAVSVADTSPHSLQAPAVLDLPEEGVPRPGNEDWLRMDEEDQQALGQVLFMHHCNDCHAMKYGYSAVAPQLTGKTEEEIVSFLKRLNRPRYFMPPWCGNDIEATLLARYLTSIRPEMPSNITGRPSEPDLP